MYLIGDRVYKSLAIVLLWDIGSIVIVASTAQAHAHNIRKDDEWSLYHYSDIVGICHASTYWWWKEKERGSERERKSIVYSCLSVWESIIPSWIWTYETWRYGMGIVKSVTQVRRTWVTKFKLDSDTSQPFEWLYRKLQVHNRFLVLSRKFKLETANINVDNVLHREVIG